MRLMIACRAIDNMAGGVERQAIALANEMVKRGHEVSLLTLDPKGAQAFYDIDGAVNWYKLDMGDPAVKAGLSLRLKRMGRVRDIMKAFKPDVVLAFQQGMFLTLRLYTLGMSIPVVAAERESPFRYDFLQAGKYRELIFQTFRLAPHITVQCDSYVEAYPTYLQRKITVVPNAVFPASRYATPEGQAGQEKILLCVARLSYAKNQTVLIEAFGRVAEMFPDWTLVLAGEGESRQSLEAQIQRRDLQERVRLLGAVKDVSALYTTSHLLCIPSRFEGFPNVLGEALAHGLPAVGYQDCGGVRDLIEHGKNGWLAEGNGYLEPLVSSLKEAMAGHEKRKAMGKEAIESVEKYQPEKIYDRWEAFLKKVYQ